MTPAVAPFVNDFSLLLYFILARLPFSAKVKACADLAVRAPVAEKRADFAPKVRTRFKSCAAPRLNPGRTLSGPVLDPTVGCEKDGAEAWQVYKYALFQLPVLNFAQDPLCRVRPAAPEWIVVKRFPGHLCFTVE